MCSARSLQHALITWFEADREDLPWRADRDPYRVWVSEVMLQQTQVRTVIAYFNRFMGRFPDIQSLAAASLDEVLKVWEGLGYYSRARALHRAARLIVENHSGQMPSSTDELMKLPGIGRYTAGAIASLAFNQDAAAVDGNVIRVLTRLFNIDEDIAVSKTQALLWEHAQSLIPAGKAGLWNEGLMELGRKICTPKQPACSSCPLVTLCEAYRLGVQDQRPVRASKKRTPHYDVTAAVIEDGAGHILIAQRPAEGLLGGLWEFPGGKREPGETLAECLQREIAEELGIVIEVGQQLTVVKHSYTHFRITLYAFFCRLRAGQPQALECTAWEWVRLDQLPDYAFPVTDRKIIAALVNGSQLGFGLS